MSIWRRSAPFVQKKVPVVSDWIQRRRCALDQRSYNMNFVYTHINELDSIAA